MQVLREATAGVDWKASEERWMRQGFKEGWIEGVAKGYRRYKYSMYHLNHVRVCGVNEIVRDCNTALVHESEEEVLSKG